MRKYLAIFFISLLTTACNDGDVIEVQLDFDKELSLCEIQTTNQQGSTSESLLFFDTRTDPFESLSLVLPNTTATQAMFNPINNGDSQSVAINGSTTQFHYRAYNGDPNTLFCSVISPADVAVTQNYSSSGGTATFAVSYTHLTLPTKA